MNNRKNIGFVANKETIDIQDKLCSSQNPSRNLPDNQSDLPASPWTAELQAQLGVLPDTAIATAFGVSKVLVRARRLQLGIPAAKRLSHRRTNWTKEMDDILGLDTDATIAQKIGVSAVTVNQRRRLLQIPSFKKMQRQSARENTHRPS